MRVMPRGKAHPPEVRARAVAEMVTGAPVSEVCERYGLPERTAFDWLEDARRSQFVRSEPGQSREVAKVDLLDRVNALVEETVETLTVQSRFARRDDWLIQQDAPGLAAYRGVDFDRLIRLLAAFQRSDAMEERHATEGDAAE
jgi:transposase-like protein